MTEAELPVRLRLLSDLQLLVVVLSVHEQRVDVVLDRKVLVLDRLDHRREGLNGVHCSN